MTNDSTRKEFIFDLIDCIGFYAMSAIFKPYNGGHCTFVMQVKKYILEILHYIKN